MIKLWIVVFVSLTIFKVNLLISQTPYPYANPRKIDSLRMPMQKAGIPLITDLDKDGQKEIITFSLDYNGTISPIGLLYVIKSNGDNYPGFPKGYNEYPTDIASGDVDGDGYLDIAMRFTFSIDVIDKNGISLKGFPISYSDGDIDPFKFISLYDLENDGKLEIIASKKNEICVFNFDGTIRNGWPSYIPGVARYNPAIGDLDNDGYAEIITNSFRNINNHIDSAEVNVFTQNGNSFSNNWPLRIDSNYYSWSSSPSLYLNKINPDSTFILVVAGKVIDGMSFGNHKFMKINKSGTIIAKKYYLDYMDYGTIVIGDMDKDGIPEFASGTQTGYSLSVFDDNLTRLSGWPREGGGEHYATTCIGKLTHNNTKLNVINNTWSASGDSGGYIFAYDLNGEKLSWSPLRPIGLVKAISISDLNNDGNIEVIAIAGKMFQDTYICIWTIPGIHFTHDDFPWPQYGHDRYRTNQFGFVPPDEPVGIQPISTIVPEKFILFQNYPNPFNPVTTIKFNITTSSFVRLTVFDALGRELETLLNESVRPGSYSLVFDGSHYISGVYFYRLTSDSYTDTKKMLLIK